LRVQQFVIDGLGHLSTLLADDEAGVAAIVDPRRDVDVYLAVARELDLRITHVVETHLHNDYVSGGRELSALTGATHVIGAGAELRYEHRGTRHGEEFAAGGLRFTTLETPGHTPEHVSYAVADTSRAEEPLLLLTGGSLLVGAVGRTDLLGAENAVPFARAMYRSLHDVILPHEDFVGVYPTHGAGSLCSTGIASTPFSSVGFERRYNPLVAPMEVDAFARALLAGQPAFPRYFARMRPTNQGGPRLLGGVVPEAPPLALDAVRDLLDGGAVLVDARTPAAFATAHVPGSVSIPAGSSFGTWLGWVVDHDRPIALLLDRPEDADDLVRQALRIGYESIAGHLQGGFPRWMDAGLSIESSGRLTVDDLASALAGGDGDEAAPFVIDVRQASEYEDGHVPGAIHVAAGSLPERLAELPRGRPIAVVCASGYRASVGSSLLEAAGFTDVAWVADGVPAWRAAGYEVEQGSVEDLGPDAGSAIASGGGSGPRAAEDASGAHSHAH
jgi:hydroxyacylglutathione hydrolase